jgi:kynureninase
MDDQLLQWRPEFPILEKTTYLISNSLGAMPRSVSRRMQDYADTWASKGVRAWADEWWDMPVRVGDAIAPLVGAGPGEISMHPNITLMEAIILSCFEGVKGAARRTTVVCEELNFPSVLYLLRKWTATHGSQLRLVHSDDGVTVSTQRMVDAIDETTLLVPISHVLFRSAYIQDVRAIIARAHAVGALVVVDAYQSVGTVPVDVKSMEVDFLVGGVLKWLCGGPGGAFLYVRPDLAKTLEPRLTGWLAHRRPFDFDPGEIEYHDSSFRFLNGTPAIPALYAAAEGPRIVGEIGIEAIRRKSVRQTSMIIEEADRRGWAVRSPRQSEQRGGTVTVDVPHGYAVAQELISRSILVDYRKGAGIRLAPHFYTSDEELRFAMGQMRMILEEGSFRRHMGRDSVVT